MTKQQLSVGASRLPRDSPLAKRLEIILTAPLFESTSQPATSPSTGNVVTTPVILARHQQSSSQWQEPLTNEIMLSLQLLSDSLDDLNPSTSSPRSLQPIASTTTNTPRKAVLSSSTSSPVELVAPLPETRNLRSDLELRRVRVYQQMVDMFGLVSEVGSSVSPSIYYETGTQSNGNGRAIAQRQLF